MRSPNPVFTPEEVDGLIPRMSALIARLHASARALQAEREAVGGGEPCTLGDVLRARPNARALVEDIEAASNEIAALGGQLKDLSLGLVDFPGIHAGEEVLLCWQYGEPQVAFWHRPAEGFAGRRRLPGRRRSPHLQ